MREDRPLSGRLTAAAAQNIEEKNYWLSKLSGKIVRSSFPGDYSKRAKHSRRNHVVSSIFPGELFSRLVEWSRGSDVRLYITMAGGVSLLLDRYRYEHQEDIILGTSIYRQEVEADFINTVLVLKNTITPTITFKEFLTRVGQVIREANLYQNYPIEALLQLLNINASADENFPLFDIAVLLESLHDKRYLSHIHLNIIFIFKQIDEGLEVTVEYNSLFYKKNTIERMISHLFNLLKNALSNVTVPLSKIDVLTEEEKNEILFDINDTKSDYPRDKTMHQLFEEQALRTPGNIAVIFAGKGLTYNQLNEKANRWAWELRKKGLKPNHFAGVIMDRSIEMVIGVMAILKAGGAYVPLEPGLPDARITVCLSSLKVESLLTNCSQLSRIAPISEQLPELKHIVCLDDIQDIKEKKNVEELFKSKELILTEEIEKNPGENLAQVVSSTDSAYVIFTSGTTGIPKGVVEQHRPVINIIQWVNKTFDVNGFDKLLFVVSLSFDLSVYDIFGILASGAAIRVAGNEEIKSPERLLEIIFNEEITFWDSAPAALQMLVPNLQNLTGTGLYNDKSKLRLVFLSGDWIPVTLPDILKENFEGVEVVSLGGATEATIWSNYYLVETVDPEWISIPYGKPVQNAKYYILDQHFNPCPIGVPGDLYIGGECLATCYFGDEILTAEKFVDNPFVLNEKMYKTGDLARWFPDKNMEFLGRMDNQVKIRGYRIELGEIESRLLMHDDIKETVVLARGNANGDKYLCAYYVGDFELDCSQLSRYLSKTLPDYMIPLHFVSIDRMPLTPNGKVDRKALPEPVDTFVSGEYIAPQGKIEEALLEIWSEILGLDKDKISMNADFFWLGGHSLNANQMISRIHKKLNVKLPLAEVFKRPSLKELSEYIKHAKEDKYDVIESIEKKEYYTLSSPQKRLYFLQQLDSKSTSYNMPMALPLGEDIDKDKIESILKKLISRHESFRTYFVLVGEEPIQRIHHTVEANVRYYADLKDFVTVFDLSRAPLLRVGLIKETNTKHILVVDMHHIISDGTSFGILREELMALYRGIELSPLRIYYKDYADWQTSKKYREALNTQEEFWLRQFEEEIPVLNLPIDYARPLMQSFEGNRIFFELTREQTSSLKTLALGQGGTVYMFLLSAFYILLSKLSGQEDIVIGTPLVGRRREELHNIIGMFVNTLPLRTYPVSGKTFMEFFNEVKMRALEAFQNQDYPFEDLVERVVKDRDTSRNPIFDALFNMLNPGENDGDFPGVENDEKGIQIETQSKFDLELTAVETGGNLNFSITYCSKLFKPGSIERISKFFTNILSQLSRDISVKIKEVSLITEKEKRDFINMSAGEKKPADTHMTIHRWFDEKVKEIPDNIAVVFEDKFLTYKALDEKANRLAVILREKGVKANVIVALMLERSIEMIIGILGILRAGGAYLPIDTGYPSERIKYMINDSRASIILTGENMIDQSLFASLINLKINTMEVKPIITPSRKQIDDFDSLPIPDRSLVDYSRYHQYISSAMAKHTVSLQTTRGCPYKCIYCNKICGTKYVVRSAENIFKEIRLCYESGVRRFAFVDDVFNLNKKIASDLLNKIIRHRLDVQLFFSNGLRGDILSKEFIDLMIEAGTATICLALESASKRIQKLIKKNLNLTRFEENIKYIIHNYPQVILELELMHGFPTETEEEAMETLEFLMDLKWVHFPDLHILKIYRNTEMYRVAVENGIPEENIARSSNLAYHQIPETLPFSKDFTRKYQTIFLNDYFFLKERLLKVLPYQVKLLTEDELVQKYDSYLPTKINCFPDILECLGISIEDLGNMKIPEEDNMQAPLFSEKVREIFPQKEKNNDAFKVLLIDLSLLFSNDRGDMLYDVVEAPLGLIYLMTYLNTQFEENINGKIVKSRIDFDSYDELRTIIFENNPDLIGIRTLSIYKEFFHTAVSLIRLWGYENPIAAGGPYATCEYMQMLQDVNIDLAVIGEGEVTFSGIIKIMMANDKNLPPDEILKRIPGIAFISSSDKKTLREKKCDITFIDEIHNRPAVNLENINTSSDLVYLIYTSGSTGKPKGVMLEHRNVVNLVKYDQEYTNLDFSKILQFHSIGFDASFHEIFCALLSGGQLYLIDNEARANILELLKVVERDKINTLFLPMSLLRVIFNEKEYIKMIPDYLRHIQTAGEQVVVSDQFREFLESANVYLHNHYGPSETHVVTALTLDPKGEIPGLPTIGKPILNTDIYILDKGEHPLPVGIAGELVVGGIQVGRGYLNRPELTAEKFDRDLWDLLDCHDGYHRFYRSYIPKKIYKTGDLARWSEDGNIEFLGRIDNQVKIRGFRIEPGEIEAHLLRHELIKESVVTDRIENGDKYLCAYVVAAEGDHENLTPAELGEYLSQALPDYMVPSYFVFLDKIPLTPSGKVDRRALPAPGITVSETYKAPENEIEKRVAAMWSKVLNVDKEVISIDSNFFGIGGHSLKATVLVSKIHKELNIKIPLAEMFKTPTIRGMAKYITAAEKEKFITIEPMEAKEYYALSFAQKRLYILQQIHPRFIGYNLPSVLILEGDIHQDRFSSAFNRLVKRHESLRTSFIKVGEMPVQKIQYEMDFEVQYYDISLQSNSSPDSIIKNFIRPFDLAKAPMVRVGLIKRKEKEYILVVDMHHIITDEVSYEIFNRELILLYSGEELAPLKLQYKDFSEWQNSEIKKELLKKQEEYWLKKFKGEIPTLNFPIDYDMPEGSNFGGAYVVSLIPQQISQKLKDLNGQIAATLFMFLLAVFNILLSRCTGQEDIIIGSPITGRNHHDSHNIIGMFVNMLALRNRPEGRKTFIKFVKEVRQNVLDSFENRDYQFDELVRILGVERKSDKNPLFNIVLAMQNMDNPEVERAFTAHHHHLNLKPYEVDIVISRFDLNLFAREINGRIHLIYRYSTGIFKEETIKKLAGHYIEIIDQVTENPDIKLEEIILSSSLLHGSHINKEKDVDFDFEI